MGEECAGEGGREGVRRIAEVVTLMMIMITIIEEVERTSWVML